MARFLTTTDTSAAIERVIREAEKELTLISAYVYPRIIYLDRLRDAAARGVRISLVFGKQKMNEAVREQFAKVPNLRIYYLDEMHAKCYFNEKEAVITSLNMLNSSEAKNREMGVLLTSTTDAEAYQDCLREARSIMAAATPLAGHVQERADAPRAATRPRLPATPSLKGPVAVLRGRDKEGFCIRCAAPLPFSMDKPLCIKCYKEWARWENPLHQEAHCHGCGKEHASSFAKPLCRTCYKQH